MKYISADLILDQNFEYQSNKVIVLDENEAIIDITNTANIESSKIQKFRGLIVPGFVNSHCHLELSHLKGVMSKGLGQHNFIGEIVKNRLQNIENREECIKQANLEMEKEGIVAVADISNEEITFELKKHSKIKYHTFFEVLGLNNSMASNIFSLKSEIVKQYSDIDISITPHSPYSLSTNLFKEFEKYTKEGKTSITIHNQEGFWENEMYKNKSGKLFDLMNKIEKDMDYFQSSGKSSLQSYFKYLENADKIMLVHNTYTSEEDIEYVSDRHKNVYWCFCPCSNLYLENQLPQIDLFYKKNQKYVIGTDGLSSNSQLSIWEEIRTVKKNFNIPLETIIKWATLNGAEFLGLENELGSISVGKKPGLNLISEFDSIEKSLTNNKLEKII